MSCLIVIDGYLGFVFVIYGSLWSFGVIVYGFSVLFIVLFLLSVRDI